MVKKSSSKKHGGKRKNSGRKSKLKDDARQAFYKEVDKRWKTIMKKLGVWIDKGDKEVLLKIIEQRIGKAPQSVEVGGKDGGPIEHKVIYLPKREGVETTSRKTNRSAGNKS